MAIPLPTVNLNGTSREDLQDQLMNLVHRLDAAILAMEHAEPHGRDYQIGPVSYTNARTVFVSNLATLIRIRDDYARAWELLVAQGD